MSNPPEWRGRRLRITVVKVVYYARRKQPKQTVVSGREYKDLAATRCDHDSRPRLLIVHPSMQLPHCTICVMRKYACARKVFPLCSLK